MDGNRAVNDPTVGGTKKKTKKRKRKKKERERRRKEKKESGENKRKEKKKTLPRCCRDSIEGGFVAMLREAAFETHPRRTFGRVYRPSEPEV